MTTQAIVPPRRVEENPVSNGIYNEKEKVMSNDSEIARLWKLQSKINMMVLDGRRDTREVADAYQRILDGLSTFNPVGFIGMGWSYDDGRDQRSALFSYIDDYNKVKLSTDWLAGKASANGEVRRKSILVDTSSTPLNCDHFLDLWTNKEKIPESWKNVGLITFDGDVLRGPDGSRNVLYLCWRAKGWDWHYRWLGHNFLASNPSAGVAS